MSDKVRVRPNSSYRKQSHEREISVISLHDSPRRKLKSSYRLSNHGSEVVEMNPAVQVGQSFRKVGYGCTSCWGDVGAGDAEADVIYITFIVSVQHIEH